MAEEAEIRLDTELLDYLETGVYRTFPWVAALRSDPGPGIGNVHVTTAKTVAKYFETQYSGDDILLDISQGESNWKVASKLTDPQFNISIVAAIVRQLADYRFGANGQPSRRSHGQLDEWTIADAVAIWHAFRYGVPDVSYQGQGFATISDFQNRCYSLDELINEVVKGPGASQSAGASIPIFKKYISDSNRSYHCSELPQPCSSP